MFPHPAIVVVGYNRPNSLQRLLRSLLRARIPKDVPLLISIDGCNANVIDIAENTRWPFGSKRVIVHSKLLGLRDHVLSCGDLSYDYGAVIVLEDDVVVSPAFYEFALLAARHYVGDTSVSAISLYSFRLNEFVNRPFYPLFTGDPVYFLQSGSSWGQVWMKNSWSRFRKWLGDNYREDDIWKYDIPTVVKRWPATSWKKWFNAYLVASDTYSVVPYTSYTTNWGDSGTHHKRIGGRLQVPLAYECGDMSFPKLTSSIAVYDSFFELAQTRLQILVERHLEDVKCKAPVFSDTYGYRPLEQLSQDGYAFTSRTAKEPVFEFGHQLKPSVLNLCSGIPGSELKIARIKNVRRGTSVDPVGRKETKDHLSAYSLRSLLIAVVAQVTRKLKIKTDSIFRRGE